MVQLQGACKTVSQTSSDSFILHHLLLDAIETIVFILLIIILAIYIGGNNINIRGILRRISPLKLDL